MTIKLVTESAEATRAAGERIGRHLRRGDVVLLDGDLGAGKTTLAQGIARGLGIAAYVPSPTFTLVNEYLGHDPSGGPIRLYHVDLYRLEGAADLESFGFDDYLLPTDGVSLIEWPERAGDRLPERYLQISLEPLGDDRRRLSIAEAAPAAAAAARLSALGRDLGAATEPPRLTDRGAARPASGPARDSPTRSTESPSAPARSRRARPPGRRPAGRADAASPERAG